MRQNIYEWRSLWPSINRQCPMLTIQSDNQLNHQHRSSSSPIDFDVVDKCTMILVPMSTNTNCCRHCISKACRWCFHFNLLLKSWFKLTFLRQIWNSTSFGTIEVSSSKNKIKNKKAGSGQKPPITYSRIFIRNYQQKYFVRKTNSVFIKSRR